VVHRARLTEKLIAGRQGKLTLVCAPAGFGKTTLVVDFLSQAAAGPQAWFSIDEQDNDPARFLAYFIAAIQSQWPGGRYCGSRGAALAAAATGGGRAHSTDQWHDGGQ